MKRSFRTFLIICTAVLSMTISQKATAQLLFGVSFDAKGDVKSTVQQAEQYLSTAQEEIVAKVKQTLTSVKSTVDQMKGKINKMVNKIPGSKDFDEKSSVDVYDYEAVKNAFTELFLQYPSDDPRINNAYEQKAEQFYYDTLVEVKTSITELESKLATLRKEVEAFTEEAMTSEGDLSTASSTEENGVDYNVYMATRKMNDILKVTKEIIAMRNQYAAAKMLHGGRTILPAPQKQTKADATIKTSAIGGHTRLTFAQFMTKAPTETTPSTENIALSAVEGEISPATSRFVTPEAPQTSAPLEGNEAELEALAQIAETQKIVSSALEVHNLLQRLPDYRDMYKQFDLYEKLHVQAVSAVKKADGCVISYLGRHYSDPNKVWFGQSSAPENTCDYNSRKGLSGWSITAFQTANSSVGNDIDVDAFADYDMNLENDSSTLLSPNVAKLEKEEAQNATSTYYKKPSRDQEYSDSVREVELLNWLIGRKAAQILAEDQYSENPAYGKASHPFPLWNDQRSYYDQYINGKYENMKLYLQELDFSSVALTLANMLNSGQEEGEDKESTSNILSQIASAIEQKVPEEKLSTTLLNEKAEAISALQQKEDEELSPFVTSQEKLLQDLDAWSDLINKTTEDLNTLNQNAANNKIRAESINKEIGMMNDLRVDTGSSSYVLAQQNLTKAMEEHAQQVEEAGNLRVMLKKYENNRASVQSSYDEVSAKIKTIKQKYREETMALENDYENQMSSLQDNATVSPKLMTIFNDLELNGKEAQKIISKADSLIDTARSCAVQFIQDHQNELAQMKEGDTLYETSNNPSIVNKHSALIKNLQDLPRNCFNRSVKSAIGSLNVSTERVISVLRELFKPAISEICSNYTCDTADAEYFVGLPAKEADFTAPKAPEFEHYPAVRDLVHFDTTDYQKTEIGTDGKVSRNAFLEYGMPQPDIWSKILSDSAFIERGVDLNAVLSRGDEGKAFARGIQLPCRTNNYIIDVNNSGKYVVVDTKKQATTANVQKYKQLQDCEKISISGRTAGIGGVLNTYKVYDSSVDNNNTTLGNAAGSIDDVNSSELGMFLKYKEGILSINDLPYYGYTMLVEKEKQAEKSGKYEFSADDNIYQRAIFASNHVGEFLHFVDKEQEIKKSLDEIESNKANLKESLDEVFAKVNFTLRDVNFANEKDFEYISNKLKENKNILMSRIANELQSINHSNATVNERYVKLENTYKALFQDDKAMVSLTTNTEAGAPLAERIKVAETNEKVIEKSRKEGYDAIQKEIDNYEQPICMPY